MRVSEGRSNFRPFTDNQVNSQVLSSTHLCPIVEFEPGICKQFSVSVQDSLISKLWLLSSDVWPPTLIYICRLSGVLRIWSLVNSHRLSFSFVPDFREFMKCAPPPPLIFSKTSGIRVRIVYVTVVIAGGGFCANDPFRQLLRSAQSESRRDGSGD